MNIIIHGNPVDGFEYIGPFSTNEDAIRYIEEDRDLRQRDAWVAPMHLPDVELTKSEMVREMAKGLGLECVDMPIVKMKPEDLIGFLGVPGQGKTGKL